MSLETMKLEEGFKYQNQNSNSIFLPNFSDMHQAGGFATEDYDVMEKSCNNFTYCLAEKLKVDYRYPTAILKQSRMGSFLAPVAHALDIVAERSSISWATYDDGEESYSLLCRRKSCNVRR